MLFFVLELCLIIAWQRLDETGTTPCSFVIRPSCKLDV